MDANMESIQNELKVLKNEIRQVLLDIREYLLTNVHNPFPASQELPFRQSEAGAPMGAIDNLAARYAPSPAVPSGAGVPSGVANGYANGGRTPHPAQRQVPAVPDDETEDIPAVVDATQHLRSPGVPAEEAPTQVPSTPVAEVSPAAAPASAPQHAPHPSPQSQGLQPARATRPQPQVPVPPPAAPRPDLVTVAMLAPVVEEGIRKLGKAQMRSVIELYAITSTMNDEMKQMVLQLIDLDSSDDEVRRGSLRDCLRFVMGLDAILSRSRSDVTGAALLSVYLNARPASVHRGGSSTRGTH